MSARRCTICKKGINKGYYLAGDYACSIQCRNKWMKQQGMRNPSYQVAELYQAKSIKSDLEEIARLAVAAHNLFKRNVYISTAEIEKMISLCLSISTKADNVTITLESIGEE